MESLQSVRCFYHNHSISRPSPLFDAMTDTYYFAKNIHGQFVFANGLLQKLFHLSEAEEVIGKTDYDFFRSDIADSIRSDDQRVMATKQGIFNKLEVVQNAGGELLWLITSKLALTDNNGKVIGVEGYSRDAQKSQSSIEPYSAFKTCIEYLQANYMHAIKVSKLATVACMSLSTFERKFKTHFGMSPSQYVKHFRIQQACKLLIAGYSIKRVAVDCGFCDQSYFTRQFRTIMGVTPRAYQHAHSVATL